MMAQEWQFETASMLDFVTDQNISILADKDKGTGAGDT